RRRSVVENIGHGGNSFTGSSEPFVGRSRLQFGDAIPETLRRCESRRSWPATYSHKSTGPQMVASTWYVMRVLTRLTTSPVTSTQSSTTTPVQLSPTPTPMCTTTGSLPVLIDRKHPCGTE